MLCYVERESLASFKMLFIELFFVLICVGRPRRHKYELVFECIARRNESGFVFCVDGFCVVIFFWLLVCIVVLLVLVSLIFFVFFVGLCILFGSGGVVFRVVGVVGFGFVVWWGVWLWFGFFCCGVVLFFYGVLMFAFGFVVVLEEFCMGVLILEMDLVRLL